MDQDCFVFRTDDGGRTETDRKILLLLCVFVQRMNICYLSFPDSNSGKTRPTFFFLSTVSQPSQVIFDVRTLSMITLKSQLGPQCNEFRLIIPIFILN